LTGFEASAKLKIIKELKTILGVGLKEVKDLVESSPCNIKEKIPLEDAEQLKEKLEALGCSVELK
jgi:large subunit ribosomal protein L7/L12